MRLERGREAVYYCNSCDTEIDDNDIKYDPDVELDYCPHCDSTDVDYFPCEVSPEVNK